MRVTRRQVMRYAEAFGVEFIHVEEKEGGGA